jgi:hypothetical protein
MDQKNRQYKTADYLLSQLALAPIDHHSRSINDVLPKILEENLVNTGMYIDSRFLQTDLTRHVRRGMLKPMSGVDYACGEACIWEDLK